MENHTVEYKLGVVGAGLMGSGVARAAAARNFSVLLIDKEENLLARAREKMIREAKAGRLISRAAPQEDGDFVKRITFSTSLAALKDVDFIVENITESWPEKQMLYQKLGPICGPNCIIAANTSAIPISRIASAYAYPRQVMGMHFMNPVPLKTHVEVIRGYQTSPETLERGKAMLTRMGKTGIMVEDSPGFVSNRVLMLMINEAINLLRENVARVEDIDAIFTQCMGHKMGPLATADLIGLDTILLSLEVLHGYFRDGKYAPSPLLCKMVDAGELGRKSGRGFYQY